MLLVFYSLANAASITDDVLTTKGTFYRKNAEGWYWYKDPLPEEEKEKSEVLPKPIQEQAPATLSAAWVREMLPKYKDLAWDNPTPENVEAYFLIQRYAMDRSQEFANVAQRVVTGNPYLDENSRRPINTYGIRTVDRQAGSMIDKMIETVTQRAGLFFFFKSDCSYCEAQAPIIKLLEQVDKFTVLAISVDGGSLKDVTFNDTRIDQGQAEKLNVTATPSLFLVTKDGHFENLGQGVMTLQDLKRRILIGAVRAGVLSEADINATRPIMTPYDDPHNLSKQFEPLMIKAQSEKEPLMDSSGFIEPKKLLGLINDKRVAGNMNDE